MPLHTRLLAVLAVSLFPSATALALTPSEAAGEYTTALNKGSFETSGLFRMVLGKGGNGSVSVKLGDKPVCVIGIGFGDYNGGYGNPVYIRGDDPAMTVRIEIIQGPDGGPLAVGQVGDDGIVYRIQAPKGASDSGLAIGRHTFMLGSSVGVGNAGSGFAKVSAKGRVTGAASVKGGRAVAFGGRLSPTQELPIATRLGGADSSLVGSVTFGAPATTGNVTLHVQSTNQSLLVGGAPYDPRQTVLWRDDGARTFPLEVYLDGTSVGSATWTRGAIRVGTLNGTPLRLSVNRTTGVVTGRAGSSVLRGVAVQGFNQLGGLVNGVTRFGVYPVTGAIPASGSGGLQKAGPGEAVIADPHAVYCPPGGYVLDENGALRFVNDDGVAPEAGQGAPGEGWWIVPQSPVLPVHY